jgi:hypothetical protein
MSSVDVTVLLTREIRQLYLSGTYTDIPSITAYLQSQPRFSTICKRYPSMIPIICSNNYDQERLEYMIRLSDRVQRGDISEKDASVAVGQRLVDEIVKPQINNKK